MPLHRRIPALLAALTTMAGGPVAATAAADADAETGERGARPSLTTAPTDHVRVHLRRSDDLAGALGVPRDRLAAALHELRAERPVSDVVGARPPVRTAAQRAAERDDYAAALAAKLGLAPEVVRAALAGPGPVPPPGPAGRWDAR